MSSPNPWDNLRLDYEHTMKYFHALHESRFKLLALLPIVTGTAIGTADIAGSPQRTLALGLFGFLITLGLTFYEVRNTQLYDVMQLRAKSLEAYLGLARAGNPKSCRSGPLLHRPESARKLFGIVKIWHDRALSIVYSTLIAGWSYLITASITQLAEARSVISYLSWLIPTAIWIAFVVQLHRYDNPTDALSVFSSEVKFLLQQPANEPWLGIVLNNEGMPNTALQPDERRDQPASAPAETARAVTGT